MRAANSLRDSDSQGGISTPSSLPQHERTHAAFTTAIMTFWTKLVKRNTGTARGGRRECASGWVSVLTGNRKG